MSAPYEAAGFQMIRSIEVRNFRCYRHLELTVPARLNVVVGDNGSGKTSLLEAIFLALCSTSQIAVRYRQERGMDGAFNGTARRIEDALFSDLFSDRNTQVPIFINLSGDGEEQRSVVISRGQGETILQFGDSPSPPVSASPIVFRWTASDGVVHESQPSVGVGAVSFPETVEELPNFFLLPANGQIGSVEAAQRFSDLGKTGRRDDFIKFITGEYQWIKNLEIEAVAGAPVIFATLEDGRHIPLPSVSSGINRIVNLLLCIAGRPRSVVLVDEIEVGTHYSHHRAVWSALLSFMRAYDSQLFVTTHSKECLEALASAVGDKASDVALWRVEKNMSGTPDVFQFTGDQLVGGIEYGSEIR